MNKEKQFYLGCCGFSILFVAFLLSCLGLLLAGLDLYFHFLGDSFYYVLWGPVGILGLSAISFKLLSKQTNAAQNRSRVVELASTRPPHSLDGFNLKKDSGLLRQITINAESIGWHLECPCGGKYFAIHGIAFKNEKDYVGDPVVVTCSSCSRTIPVFDGRQNGYNAMINVEDGLSHISQEKPPIQHTLTGRFQLAVVCQYSFGDDEPEESPELFENHTGDYFTNIIGYGQRDGQKPKVIFDKETA